MYFDSHALIALVSDDDCARKLAPVIEADWKRVTSPLAMIEAAIEIGEGFEPVRAFVDQYDIEIRDMPPATRLVELAEATAAAGPSDFLGCMTAACVAYYEVELFDADKALEDLTAQAAAIPEISAPAGDDADHTDA